MTAIDKPKESYHRIGHRLGRVTAIVAGIIGVAVFAGSVGVAQTPVASPSAVGAAANPTLATHVISQAGRATQLVVVDTETKVIAVYQIDPNNGSIALASVRNITWDLQVEELNSKKLFPPKDIRAGLHAAQ